MKQREIIKTAAAQPATDGAGVKIRRLAGFSGEYRLDPFLMLDEIRSDSKDDFIAGFPPHPHRGFETVTYMKEGAFSHEDSMGNRGRIGTGGAQWMTAGSGVIHSEMPEAGAERMHGFQFWLNLPATEKMQTPEYRDIQGGEITEFDHDGTRVRLIAGTLDAGGGQRSGVVTGKTSRALIADVIFSGPGSTTLAADPELTLQFYVYAGSVDVGGSTVEQGTLAYLGAGDTLRLKASAYAGLLLFGGLPLDEPVVHHGPFVMNSAEEIRQAVSDFQNGVLVQAR